MNLAHTVLGAALVASLAVGTGAVITSPTDAVVAPGSSSAGASVTQISWTAKPKPVPKPVTKPTTKPVTKPVTKPAPKPVTGARMASASVATNVLSEAARPAQVTEWRRLDRTSLATLTPAMRKWAAYGGNEMVIDVSFLVDLAEQKAPTAGAYKALAAYVRAARNLGLTTSAVAGTPTWVHYPYVVDLLDSSLDRYNAVYPNQAITSLTYDIEPWSTPEFGADPQAVTAEFLDWTKLAMAKHDGFMVGIFAPYWMDGRAHIDSMVYDGVAGTPATHLGRIVSARAGNFINIMAYQDTTARLLNAVPAWADTGANYRVSVEVGPSDAGSTWYGSSKATIIAQVNTVAEAQASRVGFMGATVDSVTYLP